MVRAACRASLRVAALLTLTSISLVAPSPSRAIPFARKIQTWFMAFWKISAIPLLPVMSSFFARPLAMIKSVSLGLVSPSTEIILKEIAAASCRDFLRYAGVTLASVVRKASMVAMLG